mmetsp:Transcript_25640/g.101153  ORF Transcript_25640/g.101153 Transcript_25640/m.101153 type:complete len:92 (+) Transcript_25640:676-951(+)
MWKQANRFKFTDLFLESVLSIPGVRTEDQLRQSHVRVGSPSEKHLSAHEVEDEVTDPARATQKQRRILPADTQERRSGQRSQLKKEVVNPG